MARKQFSEFLLSSVLSTSFCGSWWVFNP